MDELNPLLTEIGFERKGKLKFCCINDDVEMRFILSIRYPKYSDDKATAYVSPVVHLYFREAEHLLSEIVGGDVDKGFPTLGGNLGGFNEALKYIELPIASMSDKSKIFKEIKNFIPAALIFWEKYSSMSSIVDSYKKHDPLLPKDKSWTARLIVMHYLSNEKGSAINLLENNRKKLGKDLYSQLKNYLIKEVGDK